MGSAPLRGDVLVVSLGALLAVACDPPPAPQLETTSLEQHDFILNCAGCHRLDGTGSATVPSLHDMKELGVSTEVREYLIRVPGVSQAPLSDQRLAAMMNWVVERFTGELPLPLYTASDVGDLRRRPLLDPIAARAAITRIPRRLARP